MLYSNYLTEFLNTVDDLLSRIKKLDSKKKIYKKNSDIFGMNYDVHFSISPDYFVKLRSFLQESLENGYFYDKNIVDLKREFSRNFVSVSSGIERELLRIDEYQVKEMNRIVKDAICDSEKEINEKNKEMYDVESNLFEKFIGKNKFRKLMVEQYELKIKLIEKKRNEMKLTTESMIELVNMMESTELKTGELLWLEEEIIKAFKLDKNLIKSGSSSPWRVCNMMPRGIFAQREQYKLLNKNAVIENQKLRNQLNETYRICEDENSFSMKRLINMNVKLSRILKEKTELVKRNEI